VPTTSLEALERLATSFLAHPIDDINALHFKGIALMRSLPFIAMLFRLL
jgi:hypothetical protein